MSIKTASNFDLSRILPLDTRVEAANASARFNIKWVHKGIRVRDFDTGNIFEYIGSIPTGSSSPPYTVAADWLFILRWLTGSGAPSSSLGFDGDLYLDTGSLLGDIHKKTTGTWAKIFDMSGADILTDNADPSDANGKDGDIFIQNLDGASFLEGDFFRKASGTWGSPVMNILGAAGSSGDKYASISVTSVDLDAATDPINITIALNLAWTVGQLVVAASRADPAVDFFTGTVTSYVAATGVMQVSTITRNGTLPHTDWDVNISGTVGEAGQAFKITARDINFTTAVKEVDIEPDSQWTTKNPWIATVADDQRSTADIQGDPGLLIPLNGRLIIWNGSFWIQTKWLGPKGSTGDDVVLTIGNITTLAAGAAATASVTGTAPNFVLNLGIPQGIAGSNANAGTFTTDQIKVILAPATTGIAKIPVIATTNPSVNVWDGRITGGIQVFGFNASGDKIWPRSSLWNTEGQDEAIVMGQAMIFSNNGDCDVTLRLYASLGGAFSGSGATRMLLGEAKTRSGQGQKITVNVWGGFKATQQGSWYFRVEGVGVNTPGLSNGQFQASANAEYLVMRVFRT